MLRWFFFFWQNNGPKNAKCKQSLTTFLCRFVKSQRKTVAIWVQKLLYEWNCFQCVGNQCPLYWERCRSNNFNVEMHIIMWITNWCCKKIRGKLPRLFSDGIRFVMFLIEVKTRLVSKMETSWVRREIVLCYKSGEEFFSSWIIETVHTSDPFEPLWNHVILWLSLLNL